MPLLDSIECSFNYSNTISLLGTSLGRTCCLLNACEQMPQLHVSEEIKLDMRVNYIAFNKIWIAKLNEATWEDPILSTVYQLTQ